MLHPEFRFSKLAIGSENASLLVVDNFVNDAERLVEYAVAQQFVKNAPFYPGVRAEAPECYQSFFLKSLQSVLIDFFELDATTLAFELCHFSLVTTPAKKLQLLQRIPHFDSTNPSELAAVHYLFKGDLGGTSFYRHKKTNFEYIDEHRKLEYFRSLETENGSNNIPSEGYINGNTPLFEQVGKQEGVFNRMVVYRRNTLHSGSISKDFMPDSNPLTGRLSINSFLRPV